MDSTFDLSRKEQLSFIVRYINYDGNICERLLALKESAITTSVQIFDVFQNICTELSLDWVHFLVGQSYDGAQNMRGQNSGLQALIKEKCPSATYIWCTAHRLNLVVVKAVSSSLDAVDLFGNMETLYNFICGSKKRVAYYEKVQNEYSAEPNLAPTQWRLGRIIELHPSSDNVTRVVTLKTERGQSTQAVRNLCLLPID